MGISTRNPNTITIIPRKQRYFSSPFTILLAFTAFTALFLIKVNNIISETKTLAGHNLDPTPWHLFPANPVNDDSKYSKASKIIQCSYLSCPRGPTRSGNINIDDVQEPEPDGENCPEFFRWIHRDLEPWGKTRISLASLEEARRFAAFRVVIVGGRLYVDLYYACVQSRGMFTIWGLLQLLRRYPGKIPDVDIMFDCMDRPVVNRTEYWMSGNTGPPPPLFRYCTTKDHFDIPFPDWSFWGWPEVNIGPWDEEFISIKQGSQTISWANRSSLAYWKGNPDVDSPVRTELLRCNDSSLWKAQILRQNWVEEAKGGYEQSKLANQCRHRYKIYAEGYAWSVSLKYILSCGSPVLLISPQYEDFFSRGLVPRENYWPISTIRDLCESIKFAVNWGNKSPSQAETIGKGGQALMEALNMDRVYEYMYHLITEYSKLQDFKPSPPSTAREVCEESLLCFADEKQREFLKRSTVDSSSVIPCTLPPADHDIIDSWIQQRMKIIRDIQKMENMRKS
ncbi:hypothetical protein GIB67_036772 [Kingdonia uniflora]|uniref:Glycosyl transferase CAP10 domain-containing protein n=1 Tax=Kingdonia uniflora TaxID=39325 RepID=A0A7J7LWN6_9MAGN|nr:hypothetical protein GIB67_036772 [Kingdonia uniflora]